MQPCTGAGRVASAAWERGRLRVWPDGRPRMRRAPEGSDLAPGADRPGLPAAATAGAAVGNATSVV